MRNKTVLITAAVCFILFAASLCFVICQHSTKPASEIEVLLDGKLIYSGSGEHQGEPLYIDAIGKNYSNHIRIDENGVLVESSTCPNQECVRMGYLKNRALPIVCLPNNLVIRYTGQSNSSEQELDAISQ